MNKFESNYLELLHRQLQEEINFLFMHGHNSTVITTPCPFCYGSRDGNYRCNRVNELRQFQSSVEVGRQKNKAVERRPIGQMITIDDIISKPLELLDSSDDLKPLWNQL